KTYFNKGLLYKGPYIVQWCPKCNTAIEDVEVEYEEREDKLYYVKYLLNDKGLKTNANSFITVATVRLETMFSDVAIAVNPKDKKYKDLIGKSVIVPFINRKVPIITDNSVDIKFGSGALKIDPAHSLEDWRIGNKNHLEVISVINKDGRLNENAGMFKGLKAYDAREQIFKELEKQKLIDKFEDIKHTVPVCERCKSQTEILISQEWFVKVEELAKGAISVINRDEIKFLPKNYKKILVEWLKEIHDWCISRNLWWGHRIPVWYKKSDKFDNENIRISLDSPGPGWVQDEQVLDTWFSSGLWPISTLGWGDESQSGKSKWKALQKYFPWDFEITAPEIKYLWIARMIMLSKYFMDDIPFKTMFFHGMLRDLEGRKFSKSLGNGIDPVDLVNQWGVDAVRMALYTYSIPGRDGRVSKQLLDERCKNFRNFGTKLKNIAKFVLELKPLETSRQRLLTRKKGDQWIMAELKKTTKKVTKNLDNLELHLAIDEIYNFVWHKFADKYIEQSKSQRVKAQPTLEHVLKQVLILLHPFMPFLTEELYQQFKVKRKSIMLEDFPQ
ncbi:valine--tRNA ligase, partial [Candidatus Curtissbacteria bacterium RBG_13_35_7]